MVLQKRKKLLIVNMLSLVLFMLMLVNVVWQTSLVEVDLWVNSHMDMLRSDALVPIVRMVTDINGFVGAALFFLLVSGIFFWKGWIKEIWFFLFSTLGATALFALIKAGVGRSRPVGTVLEISGYSFPSGHTTMATAMAFALYFILKEKTTSTVIQFGLLIGALGWALLIAWTRLYLDVHWFTDVIGGVGLGLFWVTLLKLFFKSA